MSVLIKDMEMPTSCDDCRLNNGISCYAVPEYTEDDVVGRTDDRPDYCPLIPVPAHGRLIDADALRSKLNMMIAMAFGEGNTAFHFAYRSLVKVVENAPTVIEAEEGE